MTIFRNLFSSLRILRNIKHKFSFNSNYKIRIAMAAESLKTKSDLDLQHETVKKMKLDDEVSLKRTVATMCGAWRPEEEYGGLVLVFPTRDPGLSPDPTRECDYPENIEDFWEASLQASDDDQAVATSLPSTLYALLLLRKL